MTLAIEPWAGQADGWDSFVRAQDGWTHFHLAGWRRVMERVHGHECLYLAAHDADALAGVLPLVRVKSLLFGHYLVSMPYLNYGGPLGTPDAIRALADAAAAIARRDGAALLELRSRIALPVDLPASHRKITVLLDLVPGEPGRVFDRFKAKLRSQVRRPQKEGVSVRFGADQVGPFYAVFARHMRDLGTPAQPRALFEAIAAEFPRDAWFACAWLGGRPVACGAGFRWGAEFEMTWASSLVECSAVAPNMGLYWAFIERATLEGCAVFNFGRCTSGSGTHRFKRQWGGRDEPLWWYQLAAGKAATPSPDDGAYAWGPRIWKHLPLPLATVLGPRIVRGIP